MYIKTCYFHPPSRHCNDCWRSSQHVRMLKGVLVLCETHMHGTYSLFLFCLFPFCLGLCNDSRRINPLKSPAMVMDGKSVWNKAFRCFSENKGRLSQMISSWIVVPFGHLMNKKACYRHRNCTIKRLRVCSFGQQILDQFPVPSTSLT